MGEPLVSAVIITYNQEKYIEQTIECALAQRVDFRYEIIIGEDCSTDRTRDICLRYQEKYPDIIRVIYSDENVGLLDNWARSVKAAKGKYIAGCGGDDYWHNPLKLKKQVEYLESNQNCGMVHSEIDYFYQKDNYILYNFHEKNKFNCNSENIITSMLVGLYSIKACSVTFKKELFNKYFDLTLLKEQGFLMEDTPFWFEIIYHSKIYYFKESMATYRYLTESVKKSDNEKKRLKFLISSAKFCIFSCKKYNQPDYVKKIHQKRYIRSSLKLAFLDENIKLANSIKEECKFFTLKENIWYLGNKFQFVRLLILFLMKNLLKKKILYK